MSRDGQLFEAKSTPTNSESRFHTACQLRSIRRPFFSESPNLDFTEQSHRKRSGTFEISIVDRSAIDCSGVVVHGFRERWTNLINTKSRASGRPKPLHVSIIVGPLGE